MKTHAAIAIAITAIVLLVFSQMRRRPLPEKQASAEVALSVLLPHAGGCGWYRVSLPRASTKLIARFHVDCSGAQIAWNDEASEAIVWMGSGYDVMAWHVKIGRTRTERVTAPEGDLGKFVFLENQLFAYMNPVRPSAAGTWVRYADQQWVDSEPAAPPPPSDRYPSDWQPVADNYLFEQLDPLTTNAIRSTGRVWHSFRPADTDRTLLAFAAPAELPEHIPALLKWDRKGRIEDMTGLKFSYPDTIVIMQRGSYLLVAESDNHMSPHVYSWDSGELIYQSEPAHHAEFWPPTSIY